MKNILVLLWSDWKSMRNFLYGFALYARTRKDWIVHLRSPEDLSLPATANKVKSGFYSAIVANEETLKTHPEIADNPKTALVLYGACNPDFRKVGDVVAHVGVSRRPAEKRSSEIFGKSIIAAITIRITYMIILPITAFLCADFTVFSSRSAFHGWR